MKNARLQELYENTVGCAEGMYVECALRACIHCEQDRPCWVLVPDPEARPLQHCGHLRVVVERVLDPQHQDVVQDLSPCEETRK